MADIEELKDSALDAVDGGTNTTNPWGAHWQAVNYTMGTTFDYLGRHWYRIKSGDTLGAIAARYSTAQHQLTPAILKANNPATIQDIKWIYAGDAIVLWVL